MTHTVDRRAHAREIKFIVDASDAARIRRWAREGLEPDPHGSGVHRDEYHTASLYWDTVLRDVFHRRGSYGRAKYRIRRYGVNGDVFLERKLRRPDMMIKRRTRVPVIDLDRLNRPSEVDWPGGWFHKRIEARGLNVVCQVSYRRMARTLNTDDRPARLTLDDSIRAIAVDELRFSHDSGVPILDGYAVLELKFRRDLPTAFKHLIENLSLQPRTASKYRLALSALTGLPLDMTVEAASALAGRAESIEAKGLPGVRHWKQE